MILQATQLRTAESGKARLFSIGFYCCGGSHLFNMWIPESAIEYYRAQQGRLSVGDWVGKKIEEEIINRHPSPRVRNAVALGEFTWMQPKQN